MKIQAILFDKDGTLLDFNRTWLPRYRDAAACVAACSAGRIDAGELLALGGYIAQSDTWRADSLLAAGSNAQILASWESLLGRSFDDAELARIAACFGPGKSGYRPVVEPIRPCLQDLRSRGYRLGIATMDDEEQARTTADGLGISDLFDFVCGADSGFGVKPDPGMVEAFARFLDVTVASIAMVGDSPRDIHMGQRAGAAFSIGVLTGAHDAAELGRHTDHVLSDITELVTFLESNTR
jgi:phosphoglycolate phosphatase